MSSMFPHTTALRAVAAANLPGAGAAVARPSQLLFIVPYVPSRIRVRPYHILRSLAERGHRITLLCPVQGAADERDLAALRPLCSEVIAVPTGRGATMGNYLRALPGPLPLQAAHHLGAPMVEAVRVATRRRSFDAVHVEHLRAAAIALAALGAEGDRPPLLLDAVDCISLLFERAMRGSPSLATRAMALLDLARTRRYEAHYTGQFDHIVVTSPEDRWALETLARQFGAPRGAGLSVVPNGVDLSAFAPRDMEREPATLVFSGKLSYHANHAAALFLVREVMPLVWRARPEAKVWLVGADPAAELRALGSNPRVVVTGFVPDLGDYLARATLAVCPIRYGVGIQNKVLEALASAAPVVTARQTTAALGARPGHDLLTAETAPEYAAQILALLDDPLRRGALGANGRRYVEFRHDWEASAAGLEACYSLAAEARERCRQEAATSVERRKVHAGVDGAKA